MNRWETLQTLFDATAELEPDERARRLRERLGDRSELIREVERLVAADRSVTDPLHERLRGDAFELIDEFGDDRDPSAACGMTFGPYRIEELLSSGGMGDVYRAVRSTAGTERRVAIKILRRGLVAADFRARFDRECRTLAALEHEHIVSFLDAGSLPDGRPFLVMEFVSGARLTDWCEQQALGIRARIDLFLPVLAAVQYLHRSLIVHRDLKPSNVLVTAGGVPKLCDFGIVAESGCEPAAEGGPLTRDYASPEQLRGELVTTASDIYSLGLMLGELVRRHPDAASGRERRDLDPIIGKATHSDPTQRYVSADEFALDLRRHRSHRPVAARPPTWRYRSGLFLLRNRWSLALGTALVVALLAGFVGTDVGRRRALTDAKTGWGAHAQARQFAATIDDLLVEAAIADPVFRRRAIVRCEQVLAEQGTEPSEVEALLRLSLARLHIAEGANEVARAHLVRVLELARTTPGVGKRPGELAATLLARIDEG